MRAIAATALTALALLTGITLGWALGRGALPVVPYTAPVLSPAQEWPAGFYVRLGDEYRFYMLTQPAEEG
jgi:hypothetical protein